MRCIKPLSVFFSLQPTHRYTHARITETHTHTHTYLISPIFSPYVTPILVYALNQGYPPPLPPPPRTVLTLTRDESVQSARETGRGMHDGQRNVAERLEIGALASPSRNRHVEQANLRARGNQPGSQTCSRLHTQATGE